MKKLHIFGMMALALVGFTACEPDEDPKISMPTEFVLNTPPFAGQTYQLSPDGVFQITCSQPNYGLTLAPTYSVDLSLTDEFTLNEDGKPNYYSIISGSSAVMNLKESDLAVAVCTLNGVLDYNSYPEGGIPEAPLYVRAVATLPSMPPCYSNTVCLNGVSTYNPYREGGRVIYMVGDFTAWNAGDASSPHVLTETSRESNVYVGTFNVPAGSKNFRFYTEMNPDADNGGWGKDGLLPSIGAAANDGTNVEISLTDEPLVVKAVAGKGNWYTSSDWAGGDVTFVVDLRGLNEDDLANSRMSLTMIPGKYDFATLPAIYVAGDFSAWSIAESNAGEIYENYRLFDYSGDGSYYGTFYIPDGKAVFRFYEKLGDWEAGSLGSQVADDPIEESLTAGVYDGPYVSGKGSWKFSDWTGSYMKMVVNTAANQVTFTKVELTPSGEVVVE